MESNKVQSEEDFWGDQLGPSHNYMRIVYNNVNGLRIGNYLSRMKKNKSICKNDKALTGAREPSKLSAVVSALSRWDANVLCCAETQTAWELHYVREAVAAEIRTVDRYATVVGSSSAAATCEAYKPGGTATIVDGNWSSRVTKNVDAHKLGRWSAVTITGRNNTIFTIITAYRCCANVGASRVGSVSALSQQEMLLKKVGIRKSPQEMFIIDLVKYIHELTSKGHEILLNVDANELWTQEGSRIYDLAMKTGLFDIARERHGGPVPATFVRKNCARRIDYMLCSEGVLKNVRAMGIARETYDPNLGDHNPQYVDIDARSLLCLNIHDVGTPSARKLKSSNPKRVSAYLDKVKANFENHNIYQRVETLWDEMQGKVSMSNSQVSKYEALDRDIIRSCKNAENMITSVHKERYVWSPALDSASKAYQYWRLRKKHITNKTKSDEIKKWGREMGINEDELVSTTAIEKEIRQAHAALEEIQKNDRERRVEFLNSLADKYASDNDIDHATAVRELMAHEEIRELFRTIRLKLKGARTPQISEVWMTGEDGNKIVISEHDEVESHLLQRNWTQLRQASNTPFADGELGDLLHYDGTGEIAEQILHGEHFPALDKLSDTVKNYIKGMAMRSPTDMDTVDVNITEKQYWEFWKNKRESTVTSPYGLHIGHYRSCLCFEARDILDVHRKMLLMPFKFAFIPERWATTVQILLEKDSGAPWSHRLRIIELFDSQLNAGLQIIFGRRMVKNALDRGLIHSSTYGSIPNRTAQDAAIEKLWSVDIMRIKKVNGAIFDCDAKGCYDRIIAALQSITCRRWGLPRTTSLFFARLWRVCRHYIRTRHGTSNDCYMASSGELLFGIGQGNGAGPAFWLTNLVVMFFVLETMCRGMGFRSPWKKLTHRSPGLGYVDDVTLGCTLEEGDIGNDEVIDVSNDEERRVVSEISDMGQRWEEMLFANGGRLELKKCHWLLIAWKWVRGVAYLKSIEDSPAVMTITQTEDGTRVTIPRTSVEDAPRILGCHIPANGKWDFEFGKWKAEGARFALKVKQAKFHRLCGEKIYTAMWLSKVRYISSVVCFSKKQAAAINNQVVYQCLPVCGFNRHFPREVVYGPARYGGMGWENLRSIQILEKVKFFIRHVRADEKLGKLIQILVESVQLQAGISESVLNTKIRWEVYVESTWLSSLKEGLHEIDGGIVTSFKTPPLQRKFDRALMEIFCSWNLKKKELQSLNRCRVYLQVIFVSDITDFRGHNVLQEALEVVIFRKSELEWSRQVRPSPTDRRIWRKYVEKLCFNTNELLTTLGSWVSPSHQVWEYTLTRDKTGLLRYRCGSQQRMSRIGANKYSKWGFECEQLQGGYPVTVASTGLYLIAKNIAVTSTRLTRNDESRVIRPRFKCLRKTLGRIVCSSVRSFDRLWTNGSSWKIATDGGLKGNIDTCGVVMQCQDEKVEMCTAMSAETCDLGLLHSTQEELRGNLCAEIILDTLNEKLGDNGSNEVSYVSDSKSAISILEQDIGKLRVSHPLQADMDIILEIERLKRKNDGIGRQYKWVRSHQEGKILNADEKLNQKADQLATECRRNVVAGLAEAECKQYYAGTKAMLRVGCVLINKDYKRAINNALFADEMRAYLMKKYEWNRGTFQKIDWSSMEGAVDKLHGLHKVTVLKLLHFWQPTGKYVHRNEGDSFGSVKCCHCDTLDTHLHYMACKSDYFREARSFAWKRFCESMKKYKKEESLLRAIWIGIQHWIYGDFHESLPQGEDITEVEYEALVRAFNAQTEIGWEHFLTGRVAKEWSEFYSRRVEEATLRDGLTKAFGRTLINSVWIFTLQVWKRRNESVHGSSGRYSARDETALRKCVVEIYDHLQRQVSVEDEWLFNTHVRIRSGQPVPQLVGWLERVLLGFDENVRENNNILQGATHILRRICKATLYAR